MLWPNAHRPVRYGGEFGGFNERASHMADIAQTALADIEVGEVALSDNAIGTEEEVKATVLRRAEQVSISDQQVSAPL